MRLERPPVRVDILQNATPCFHWPISRICNLRSYSGKTSMTRSAVADVVPLYVLDTDTLSLFQRGHASAASVPSWVAMASRLFGHSSNPMLTASGTCGVAIPSTREAAGWA